MISVIFVNVVAAANQGAATPRLASNEVTKKPVNLKRVNRLFCCR
jgi:hypothetical protein